MDERDLVSWTALISCYDQNETYEEALATFAEMYARGITVDEVLIISVLSACANLLVVKTGAMIHGLALRIGIDSYSNNCAPIFNRDASVAAEML
ncbi:hypothetical protein RJ639_043520 [Escallonia herrerae]|uniref:Pentatricopeptide repeat-containing protein n=1 Tax=Escallonia herrerae TaxID=1293975 RepID=A0AA88WCE6_9ASTE|nr:hypothetical protein RJ639_043520 [Escallonia herrerae]